MTNADSSRPQSARKCCCAGECGPKGTTPISRRDFLNLVGVGSVALLATPALGSFELPEAEYSAWRKQLFGASAPRQYFSDVHTDARMHLGGIGTGNFEIGADGQMTTWQLFNTLRDGHVPFYFLARTGGATRLLQTAGGPDWPRVKRIEMTGEYPIATLRFVDADLPVKLELSAFSPFAPLDARFSSMPLAAYVFRVQNPTNQTQTVSLAALLQNPVGYDALGGNDSFENPSFGGNFNEAFESGGSHGVVMRTKAGREPVLDQPVTIYAPGGMRGLNAPPADRPANLKVEFLPEGQAPANPPAAPSQTVIWMEEPAVMIPGPVMAWVRNAVEAGATLLFCGSSMPLLETYATWSRGKPAAEIDIRPDIVFEDFEGDYSKWQVEGQAFGTKPALGTLPNQQKVTGYIGTGLVNTFLEGDDSTGRLTSKPFTIERRFIRFLIGGGGWPATQVRLVLDGKTVRAASGRSREHLEPVTWDVSEFEGKAAHLEIVDEQKGPWGHINVDQIEFSDLPGNRDLMVALDGLLPARFNHVRVEKTGAAGRPEIHFEGLALAPEASESTLPNGLKSFQRPIGKGKVVLATGAVLALSQAAVMNARQEAYAVLCKLVGAVYTPPGGLDPKAPGYGSLALATLADKPSLFVTGKDWADVWNQFSASGAFTSPEQKEPAKPTPRGRTVCGVVATTVEVPAGGSVEVPFLLAWHYPNSYAVKENTQSGEWIGCYYATQWRDAQAVVAEAATQFDAIRARTDSFRNSMYNGSLPYWLVDCLTANAGIIRYTGVVFQIANGDIYGWEGSNGCCPPTCTHVWGYEQSLARLFPNLEKDMRRIDFKHQQRADGGINNRTDVPSPPHPTGEKPFADGHASSILKAYREGLNSPDDAFLREYWPYAKKAVDYLIERDAKDGGGKPLGILQDDQWNTYDEALHGVTTFISGYYLAALLAGEAWGRRVGDNATADRFHEVFLRGQNKLIELCWNGEYFQQNLPDYQNRQGEVGPGCMADQLIGQWWAHQLGLGYILPREKVVSALRAVYKYNFKSDLTGWKHSPRAFAGAKDMGLIICTWPKGGRPNGVMLYSDEVWTGIEYQVAAHMIYEGLTEEGLVLVKAVRDRYDGKPRPPIRRNPWSEIECGGHYARAMSSWSLLLALSGWEYDGPRQSLSFAPRITPENFQSFFTSPEGWGSARQLRNGGTQENELCVTEGKLHVADLNVSLPASPKSVTVTHEGQSIPATLHSETGQTRVSFKKPVVITKGQTLKVKFA